MCDGIGREKEGDWVCDGIGGELEGRWRFLTGWLSKVVRYEVWLVDDWRSALSCTN